MPKVPGTSYVYTQPIYDTMQLAAAAGPLTYRFFSVPLGGLIAAIAKTNAHTNLVQPGVLERGHKFEITGVSMFVRELSTTGVRPTFADFQVVQGGWLRLMVTSREFLVIPTAMVPAGGAELNYFSNIAAAATEYKATRGVQHTKNIYHMEYPVTLEDQQQFSVELVIPGTIAAVTDVTIALHGTLTRPVV